MALGAIYALVALGYTMVYGVLQLINFAHSEVFMFGTFAVAWVVVLLPRHPSIDQSLWSALRLAGVPADGGDAASAAIALLVERVAYRPLMQTRCAEAGHPDLRDRRLVLLAEIMGLRDRIAGWFGLDDKLANYVAQARNVYSSPITIDPHRLFRSATTGSPTSTCW